MRLINAICSVCDEDATPKLEEVACPWAFKFRQSSQIDVRRHRSTRSRYIDFRSDFLDDGIRHSQSSGTLLMLPNRLWIVHWWR